MWTTLDFATANMFTLRLQDDGCILQSIGLGGNGIGDQGVSHITKALWTNTFLESLGLGGNGIGKRMNLHNV